MASALEWLAPWYPVNDTAICAGLEQQLHLEVSARHVLFGAKARLIARRDDTGDALSALPDERVAEST